MFKFCLHSLIREYGWEFFRRIALPHPVRTVRAAMAARALDVSGDVTALSPGGPERRFGGAGSIVGLGFCLKPIDPPCPSGRFNHDCAYLENLPCGESADVPAACRQCAIREIGTLALRAGAAVYVMTSAKDILLDVFAPSLDEGRFSAGLFALCRYSLKPFAVGLLAAGVRAWMFPFEKGDCRDYETWLRADRGIKEERTEIHPPNRSAIREFLRAAACEPAPAVRFEKRDHVLFPLAATGTETK
ncbi:MAG: hypothetical protein AB7V14_04020 [Kiritimatiellia bacterium]